MIPVICIAALIVMAWAPSLVAAQDEITFSLSRDFGTAFGNNIQGTFSLHGSAPASVVNLTVYFNDTEVHFVTGNTISWQFVTDNYGLGAVNITLAGIDNQGTIYKVSKDYVFIAGGQTTLILIGAIAFAVIVIIAKYGWRFRSRKSKPTTQS